MLAFGQYVVPGNQLLLWPDRGTRVPANAAPRSEGMQLILSVSRQAKQRRRRGRPAKEEPSPISQFIHVHSHGILHSVTGLADGWGSPRLPQGRKESSSHPCRVMHALP